MRLALLSFLLIAPSLALAEPLLYRIDKADSTVWLLGSVHALTADDYPLDARIESAYSEAERVVLEVSPEALDPANIARITLPLARFEDGRHLEDMLTDDEYAKLRNHVRALGIDIQRLQDFEPWFVALQVFALELMKSGYIADQGVDRHFGARAIADGKKTAGLETVEEQLRIFDDLPLETQASYLMDYVDDADEFEQNLEFLLDAWRRGDAGALKGVLETEFDADPGLRDALLTDRNRRWVPRIGNLLESSGDSLVIVGALHLVGDAGVVKLLENEGYEVKKVTSNSDR